MSEESHHAEDLCLGPEIVEAYQHAFHFNPLAITITHASTGRYLEVNAAFEALFGLRRAEVIGRRSSEFAIWADPTERARLVDLLKTEGTLRDFLAVGRHRDGSLRTCSLNASQVGTGDDRRLVLIVRDLTEQIRVERALREAAEKFSKAFHATPDAVIVSELDTSRVIEANDGFCRLLGYSRDEVVGKRTTEMGLFVEADDRAALVRELKNRGRLEDYELQLRTKDGMLADAVLSCELVEVNGAPCLMTTGRDVTRQRMAEREKANLEMQLRRTQKLESLGTLAGGIAHDFNNILTAVLAHADLATLEDEKALVLEHLDEVKKAGLRARELVRRLVAFSRQQKPESHAVDVQAVVRETLALLRSLIPSTTTVIESYLPEPQVVLGDHGQLCQVVMNLCTNASYAIGASPGTLGISVEHARMPGSEPCDPECVCITVSDTGHGMSLEVLKRMFEPFFTTKPPGEGTGLGLSVIHGIVHEHRGFVDAASEVGKGARFRVFLPLHRAALPESVIEDATLPRGHGERILFIDDEEAICDFAMQLLTRLGYRITTSCNPVEALAYFTGGRMEFDLVITDLTMPRMTGVEVATRLLARQPSLPIILISGFGGEWSQEQVKAAGLLELVPKPLTLAALAAAAKRGVQAAKERGHASPSVEAPPAAR
jgi:two-component system, cell cycle sensor histidine kinase and response regulator CckA